MLSITPPALVAAENVGLRGLRPDGGYACLTARQNAQRPRGAVRPEPVSFSGPTRANQGAPVPDGPECSVPPVPFSSPRGGSETLFLTLRHERRCSSRVLRPFGSTGSSQGCPHSLPALHLGVLKPLHFGVADRCAAGLKSTLRHGSHVVKNELLIPRVVPKTLESSPTQHQFSTDHPQVHPQRRPPLPAGGDLEGIVGRASTFASPDLVDRPRQRVGAECELEARRSTGGEVEPLGRGRTDE